MDERNAAAHPANNKLIFTLGKQARLCYRKQTTHHTLAAHWHFSSLMFFSEAALHYSWSAPHLRAVASAGSVFEVWTTVCQGADGLTNVTSDWSLAAKRRRDSGDGSAAHLGELRGRDRKPRRRTAGMELKNGYRGERGLHARLFPSFRIGAN